MRGYRKKTIDFITMGCSKNLVDSERLMYVFNNAGYEVRHNPDEINAEEVVVNTCGFIGDAKEESIEMILKCCMAKEKGLVDKVSVMGCLSQRYGRDLKTEIPEVDRWYGKYDWMGLAKDICGSHPGSSLWERIITTPRHHAYIKISEGCNRFCAFCAIPLITGRHHSRKEEEIVREVRELAGRGVSEFNIIAQDLSSYGVDLYGEHRLAHLLESLCDIEGVERIRLHYAYPADFPYDILKVMRENDKICKYLDIALQHISDNVLQNMRRHITARETRELLERIRREVPGIHLRTTLMVGFPGETDKDFEELLEFVREQKFERMGAFAYSEEDDTYAARHLEDNVPEQTKQERLEKLMSLQEEIALAHNTGKIGHVMKVVIDTETNDYYIGRTEFDSPEVDPEVLIAKKDCREPLQRGKYYNVFIHDALPFELYGKVVDGKLAFFRLPGEKTYHFVGEKGYGLRVNTFATRYSEGKDFVEFALEEKSLPEQTGVQEYFKAVEETARIHSEKGGKTVLSRVIRRHTDVSSLYENIKAYFDRNPHAFCAVLQTSPNRLWVIATPELLVDIKDGKCTTMALAGTRLYSEKESREWDAKNIEEQKIVENYITRKWADLGLDVKAGTSETVRSGNLEHIRTVITADMPDGTDSAKVIDAIAPTPAVCGFPVDEALAIIERAEKRDREIYAGYLTVTCPDGSLKSYVPLRCCCIDTKTGEVAVYVGSGITAKSKAKDEWDETEAKASVLLDCLVSD